MILRRPPLPVRYRPDQVFERSARFKRAVAEAKKEEDRDGTGNGSNPLNALTAEQRLLVLLHLAITRFPLLDKWKFGELLAQAMSAVRQRVVAPEKDTPVEDVVTAWSLAEARTLFNAWWNPLIRRAHTAAYEGSKALMIAVAGLGHTPHVRPAHNLLQHNATVISHFEQLTREGPRGVDVDAASPIVIRAYKTAMKHLETLATPFPLLAQRTNVQCVVWLREQDPDAPYGCFLAVDATRVPAACEQRSGKNRDGTFNPDKDKWIRRNVPDADWVVYTYTPDGIQYAGTESGPPPPNRATRRAYDKGWRGYKLVTLSDTTSGITLVGILVPAGTHEAHVLGALLDRLYALWPDAPVEVIVGDKLYDDDGVHRLLALNFGIHMVAKRQRGHRRAWRHIPEERPKRKRRDAAPIRYHPSITKISGEGIPYCRKHNKPLIYEGIEWPSREGLAPGEPYGLNSLAEWEKKFRVRFACAHGCGRLNLACMLWWSALTKYPHHPYGRPKLYAMRIALEGQRNTAETAFSSLKKGYKQALSGSSRALIQSKETTEALIWMALTTRALMLIASLRN